MAKTKQTVKLKAPVQIRFKQLANGNQSIYLDYYTGDVIRKENYVGGKRQYEFLKLYLIPERTREDKTKNEATLALAKAIQSKRIVEIQNDAHGFQNTNKSSKSARLSGEHRETVSRAGERELCANGAEYRPCVEVVSG